MLDAQQASIEKGSVSEPCFIGVLNTAAKALKTTPAQVEGEVWRYQSRSCAPLTESW